MGTESLPICITWARNLRALRLSIDITQREMAAAIGISPSYLCGLERGQLEIQANMIHRIISVVRKKYKINYDGRLLGLTD